MLIDRTRLFTVLPLMVYDRVEIDFSDLRLSLLRSELKLIIVPYDTPTIHTYTQHHVLLRCAAPVNSDFD